MRVEGVSAAVVPGCFIPGPGCEPCPFEDDRQRCDAQRAELGLEKSPDDWWTIHQKTRPIRTYLAGGLSSGWQDRWIADHPGEDFFDPRSVNDGRSMTLVWQSEMNALKWCDEVYAYLEADNPSGIGLAFECGYARALGKPVVLVDEKGNEWLQEACL